jgi:DNA-binding transcriptional regulator YiaG
MKSSVNDSEPNQKEDLGPIQTEFERHPLNGAMTVNAFVAMRVCQIRKESGKTQQEFAESMGTSVVAVANWETRNHERHQIPSVANQRRLLELQREAWIKQNWTRGNAGSGTALTRAIHALLMHHEDSAAQDLADYAVGLCREQSPSLTTAYTKHVASIAYALQSSQCEDGGQHSEIGRRYAREAWEDLQCTPDGSQDVIFEAMLRNELLGYEMTELALLPDSPERILAGAAIVNEMLELYGRTSNTNQPQRVLVWNALEVACKLALPKKITVSTLRAIFLCEPDQKKAKARIKETGKYAHASNWLDGLFEKDSGTKDNQ